MEISKNNIFDVKYTSALANKSEKTKGTSRIIKLFDRYKNSANNIIKFVREHKIVSISVIVFLMCIGMNLVLIYNFFKILQQA